MTASLHAAKVQALKESQSEQQRRAEQQQHRIRMLEIDNARLLEDRHASEPADHADAPPAATEARAIAALVIITELSGCRWHWRRCGTAC